MRSLKITEAKAGMMFGLIAMFAILGALLGGWLADAWFKRNKRGRMFVPAIADTLPPYSPELNPAERLWRWLRRHACRNRLFKSLDEQAEALAQTIRNLSAEQITEMCACNYLLHDN